MILADRMMLIVAGGGRPSIHLKLPGVSASAGELSTKLLCACQKTKPPPCEQEGGSALPAHTPGGECVEQMWLGRQCEG